MKRVRGPSGRNLPQPANHTMDATDAASEFSLTRDQAVYFFLHLGDQH
jgi:hypothetical protein